MNRLTFLKWMGVGILAGNMPVILAACGQKSDPNSTNETTKIDTSPREDGFQALGTVEQLQKEGSILDKKSAAKSVLIFRNPENNEIAAINPLCTHQGCTVEFKGEAQEFYCPCHGSKFALDGTVTNPPATKPLENFEVKQEENLILVKVTT